MRIDQMVMLVINQVDFSLSFLVLVHHHLPPLLPFPSFYLSLVLPLSLLLLFCQLLHHLFIPYVPCVHDDVPYVHDDVLYDDVLPYVLHGVNHGMPFSTTIIFHKHFTNVNWQKYFQRIWLNLGMIFFNFLPKDIWKEWINLKLQQYQQLLNGFQLRMFWLSSDFLRL